MMTRGWISSSYITEPLKGKRIATIGSSSIDIGHTPSEKNYIELIAERTGITILDYAVSGSTLTASTEDYAAESSNQLKKIDDLPTSNVDAILLQPAVNDDNNNRPLGTWESTSVTEVYGALHLMCKKLYDKFPTLPKGVITGQYYGTKTAQTSAYQQAIKEVCNYYSIPVCDLHHEGNTPYSYPAWQTVYASDGLHLNVSGNEVLSRRVEAFIRQMFGH
ncbi:SGNH/GDSL hydrolase family protein [Paenibacillus sp.]|uniref:SGNH/GDSL hydrolase family protein n=1 Tax=Paenibacillus sp. TaxID=58172 RepID=UPI002D3A4B17|nr:SGNH/GDSL hydrolase family protein [Paenibacillus sp.]HZG83821.1 SGNH/GDSL hydrolase family protein [Paenibacillus sp.]